MSEATSVDFWSRKVRFHRSMCAVHTPGSDEHEYHTGKLRDAMAKLKAIPEDKSCTE